MKKITYLIISFCITSFFCLAPYAAEKQDIGAADFTEKIKAKGVKAGAIKTDIIEATAKVVQVNREGRTVVLASDNGRQFKLDIADIENHLKNISSGDWVDVKYMESIAVFATAKGELPGGAISDNVEMTSVVEAIDYEARTVTLKGPSGSVTIDAPESAARFENVEKGDEVHFASVEKVAINISPVGK